jgi:DTW domain-containing protein
MTSTPLPAPSARRLHCSRCERPQRTCLCPWIAATDNRLPLLLLQHPKELGHAKGSARLLQLSLAQCRTEVADAFDDEALARWLLPGAVLLYPGVAAPAAPPPQQLVVLDGTWRHTRQMLQRHPRLQALPRVALQAPPPSLYSIRKAQQAEHRSTLEAACWALAALEGRAAAYEPLLKAFDGWVQSEAARMPRR